MNKKNLSLLFVLFLVLVIVLFNTMSTSDRLYESFVNPNAVKCAKLKEQVDTMTEVLQTNKPQNDEDRKGRAQVEIQLASIQKEMNDLNC
jgi:cell shape-determining protein MreC